MLIQRRDGTRFASLRVTDFASTCNRLCAKPRAPDSAPSPAQCPLPLTLSPIDALAHAKVLAELQKGNARFWMGAATRPEISAFERRALIMQQ